MTPSRIPAGAAFATLFASASAYAQPTAQCQAQTRFAVVVHGGEISKRVEGDARIAIILKTLAAARASLAAGASSLDVVETVVRTFEDSGAFNAGRGAIANRSGVVETDASIMDGRNLAAGAVASMLTIKNPVHAARLVMERSPHVLMVGDRGEAFVKSLGAESEPAAYFKHNAQPNVGGDHGTVGAVALDRCGHIAAATSTGGYDAKIPAAWATRPSWARASMPTMPSRASPPRVTANISSAIPSPRTWPTACATATRHLALR